MRRRLVLCRLTIDADILHPARSASGRGHGRGSRALPAMLAAGSRSVLSRSRWCRGKRLSGRSMMSAGRWCLRRSLMLHRTLTGRPLRRMTGLWLGRSAGMCQRLLRMRRAGRTVGNLLMMLLLMLLMLLLMAELRRRRRAHVWHDRRLVHPSLHLVLLTHLSLLHGRDSPLARRRRRTGWRHMTRQARQRALGGCTRRRTHHT